MRLMNPLDYVKPITVHADMNGIDPFLVGDNKGGEPLQA